jgi:pilus assembly protein CpaE
VATVKTKALIVASDRGYLDWLTAAVGESVDFTYIDAGFGNNLMERVVAAPKTDFVFCEFDPANLADRAAFVEQLIESRWHVPVVGLGSEENPELMLTAMRAGVRDFFVRGRDDATLATQVSRLLRRSVSSQPAAQTPGKIGKLFSVISGHPHESIAFFAEHLALAIVETLPKTERALLIDLATPSGAAAIFLNLNQTYTVLDAINDAHRCDQTLIDTAFTRHSSGLYVLSLPEDLLGRAQFDVDQLLELVQVVRNFFSDVVVAVDGHLPIAALAGIVGSSDRSLLLSDQSILKSRHNKYLLRALRLEDCQLDRTALVVDNYRRRLGLEPRNLAELFELPLLTTLQTESHNRIISMNSGEPMFTLARKDPYCAGVRQIAQTLTTGESKAAAAPQGLLGRFLS